MPGRKYNSGNGYRYGFNGKEMDNSTGEGNLDFGARILDVRLGRWLSVDPRWSQYSEWSPFVFALDNPIRLIDSDGEGVGEPMHHLFLTTVAIIIYDAAKAKGASGRGTLLIMAQASIESGYGNDALKRGDYNLFGVMTGGSDYKATTTHGRIRDYSNKGQFKGSIDDYISNISAKWPLLLTALKKKDFTSDDVDAALYTGSHYEKKEVRNKTGHLSYNADDISKDEKTNNNRYGAKLIAQMETLKTRLIASIDYQTTQNNTKIAQLETEIKVILKNAPNYLPLPEYSLDNSSKAKLDSLKTEQNNLKAQNAKLLKVKSDVQP
jgi:RHS repeat-associated protein